MLVGREGAKASDNNMGEELGHGSTSRSTTASAGTIRMRNQGMGFRFAPSDELLVGILVDKVQHGVDPPHDVPIREHDLYGGQGPWELWSRFGGDTADQQQQQQHQDLFFFTKLRKVSPNGSNANRRLDCGGTWSEAFSRDLPALGARMSHLRYENKGSPHHGAWLLHEFSLGHFDAHNRFHRLDEHVLCRFRRKTPRKLHPARRPPPHQQNHESVQNLQRQGPAVIPAAHVTSADEDGRRGTCGQKRQQQQQQQRGVEPSDGDRGSTGGVLGFADVIDFAFLFDDDDHLTGACDAINKKPRTTEGGHREGTSEFASSSSSCSSVNFDGSVTAASSTSTSSTNTTVGAENDVVVQGYDPIVSCFDVNNDNAFDYDKLCSWMDQWFPEEDHQASAAAAAAAKDVDAGVSEADAFKYLQDLINIDDQIELQDRNRLGRSPESAILLD